MYRISEWLAFSRCIISMSKHVTFMQIYSYLVDVTSKEFKLLHHVLWKGHPHRVFFKPLHFKLQNWSDPWNQVLLPLRVHCRSANQQGSCRKQKWWHDRIITGHQIPFQWEETFLHLWQCVRKVWRPPVQLPSVRTPSRLLPSLLEVVCWADPTKNAAP